MKKILTNDDLEIGKEYWCKHKDVHYKQHPEVMIVNETGNAKYLGHNYIWATDDNNQALEKFDIIGPIEYPNFEEY